MPIHGGCLRRRHPKAAAIRAAAVPAGGCCLSPMQGERVALFIVDKRAEARNGDVGCNLDGGPIADEAEEKVWPDIAQFGPRQSVCRRYAFDLILWLWYFSTILSMAAWAPAPAQTSSGRRTSAGSNLREKRGTYAGFTRQCTKFNRNRLPKRLVHRTSRPLLFVLMMLFLAQSSFQFALAGMGSVPGLDGGAHPMADGHSAPAADANKGGGHYEHHHAGENCAAHQCSACLANLPPIAAHAVDNHSRSDLPYTGKWMASHRATSLFRPPKA